MPRLSPISVNHSEAIVANIALSHVDPNLTQSFQKRSAETIRRPLTQMATRSSGFLEKQMLVHNRDIIESRQSVVRERLRRSYTPDSINSTVIKQAEQPVREQMPKPKPVVVRMLRKKKDCTTQTSQTQLQ